MLKVVMNAILTMLDKAATGDGSGYTEVGSHVFPACACLLACLHVCLRTSVCVHELFPCLRF